MATSLHEPRPLRVGLWVAVSSEQQARDDKESLAEQESAGRRFASSIGGEVVAVYRVPGHSRAYVFWHEAEAEMRAYRHAREDIEAGRLDVLHAIDADRLGRDPALVNQFISLATRHDCEVYLASAPHPIGQQSAGHRYLYAIQAVRAGEDQQIRSRRQQMGMKGRVRRGLFACHPPMGYEAVRDERTGEVVGYVQDSYADAVREATRLYLDGYAIAEVVRRLIAGPFRTPSGRTWSYGTVHRMLHNDAYAGLPRWGNAAAEQPSAFYDPIWDPDTFAAIVRERRRRDGGRYNRRGSGPFSGVAYCRTCSQPMNRFIKRKPSGWKRAYMRCRVNAQKSIYGTPCDSRMVREDAITVAISNWLAENATEETINEALELIDGRGEVDAVQRDLARSKRHADDLDRQRERLALALAAGDLDAQMYRTTDDGLLAQLEAERARADVLHRQLESLPDMAQRREDLMRLSADFPVMVATLPGQQIASVLQRNRMRVWCEGGAVVDVVVG